MDKRISFGSDDNVHWMEFKPRRELLLVSLSFMFFATIAFGLVLFAIYTIFWTVAAEEKAGRTVLAMVMSFVAGASVWFPVAKFKQIAWRLFGRERLIIEEGWLHHETYSGNKLKTTNEFELDAIFSLDWANELVSYFHPRYSFYYGIELSPIKIEHKTGNYTFGWDLRKPEAEEVIRFLKKAAKPHKL